jgi:hypothetical protein
MGLQYTHLDPTIRALMRTEIDRDIAAGTLYISDNLNPQGTSSYPQLLKDAVSTGTDDSLATAIRPVLNSHEKPRRLKSGGFSQPPIMRSNAHEMLAEGEFNRFYIRAVCLNAIQNGATTVEIYRAKSVQTPRAQSTAKIGTRVDAQRLLDDLRANPGVDTALGLPPGPNSGLSVKP